MAGLTEFRDFLLQLLRHSDTLIDVFNVDIQKRRHGVAKAAAIADHNHRIADADFRRAIDGKVAVRLFSGQTDTLI
jgi:hypothetical protein